MQEREIKSERHTIPTSRYVDFVRGYYPRPEQWSLAWTFIKRKLLIHFGSSFVHRCWTEEFKIGWLKSRWKGRGMAIVKTTLFRGEEPYQFQEL